MSLSGAPQVSTGTADLGLAFCELLFVACLVWGILVTVSRWWRSLFSFNEGTGEPSRRSQCFFFF